MDCFVATRQQEKFIIHTYRPMTPLLALEIGLGAGGDRTIRGVAMEVMLALRLMTIFAAMIPILKMMYVYQLFLMH